MAGTPPELSGIEQSVLGQLTRSIVGSRQQRAEKVQACIEALAQTDDVTRTIAHLCIKHYIDETVPENLLTKPYRRTRVFRQAPGLFMAFGTLHSKIVQTGEFVSVDMLTKSARSLGFKAEKGTYAAEFLYQWIAAQNPGSEAEKLVAEYGLRSGRMSHSLYNGFQTQAVLFHEFVAQDYIRAIQADISSPRSEIDPIIYLAATDDWERATAFMTPAQLRRIS